MTQFGEILYRRLPRAFQIIVLDLEFNILESDDSLIDLSKNKGESLLDIFLVFSFVPNELKIAKNKSIIIPCLKFIDDSDIITDVTFSMGKDKSEENKIYCIIEDLSEMYNQANMMNQQLVEKYIETEILKREEEFLREKNDLIESKNIELDRFAYIVSHDLKAPLRGINNLSKWIVEDIPTSPTEEITKLANMLSDQAGKMTSLIEGILEYSRAGRNKHESSQIELNSFLKELVESMFLNKMVKINIQKNLPSVVFNESALSQVFSNLIMNGIKHNDKEEKLIEVGLKSEGSQQVFYVKDNGKGIEDIFHEKVFEIFQTLEKKVKGNSGIGLSIVKKILEENNGRVWMESEFGKTTTFFFVLGAGN